MPNLVTIECGSCGASFGITEHRYNELRKTGETFYCPNGHSRRYRIGKTDEEKTIDRLGEQLREALERAGDWQHAHGELLRALRRCPVCNDVVTRAQSVETIVPRILEHLTWEHGANPRLRAIPAKTGEAR